MAAVKSTLDEKQTREIREAEFAEAERKQLIKLGEHLYVPSNFEKVHAYFADENGTKAYYGVTSILGVINKPMLIQWAANMACDYIEANASQNPSGAKEWQVSEAVLKEARVAHRKKKEDAGVKGSDVHAQIEALVKTAIEKDAGLITGAYDLVSEVVNPQVQKFVTWAKENNVRFLASEKRVYSQESWYAGTLDLILEMDGKKYIADVKTSSGIYPEHYLQMAAYQGALEEMGEHEDITGAMVINLPKRGGFEIGMNYAYDDNRLAFLAALVLYKQLNALKK